jgi:hypothetical protein
VFESGTIPSKTGADFGFASQVVSFHTLRMESAASFVDPWPPNKNSREEKAALKNTAMIVGGALCLMALSALLGNTNALTAVAQTPPVTFFAEIVNDVTNPLPVSGDVTATVEGTVGVEGAVDVSSVPSDVTGKLDEIVAELQDIGAQPSGPMPANFAEVYRDDDIGEFGDEFVALFGQRVLVSFLSISTENDRGQFRLCPFQGRCTTDTALLQVGENGKEFPGALTFSLPQPIPAGAVTFRCVNEFEDCEVTISVIGTVASPL